MKKLRLDLDELTVESFTPSETPASEGTVHAHDGTVPSACGNTYCTWPCCYPDTYHC